MADIGLDEVGSKVRTSKMPQQLSNSLVLLMIRILVGSKVRQANPLEWMCLRPAVKWITYVQRSDSGRSPFCPSIPCDLPIGFLLNGRAPKFKSEGL